MTFLTLCSYLPVLLFYWCEKQKMCCLQEEEKRRFLALSDREKRALAADRRMLAASSDKGAAAGAVVLSRCYQCGADISGKVWRHMYYSRTPTHHLSCFALCTEMVSFFLVNLLSS